MRVDKSSIREAILTQSSSFCIDDLVARIPNVSASHIYGVVRELIGSKNVIADHKIGKRIYYSVSSRELSSAASSNLKEQEAKMARFTPIERIEHVKLLTDMVIDGITPSILITGMSGIGKTFLVRSRLQAKGLDEGVKYQYIQGHSSPLGLYTLLHNFRDYTLIFDDCDSVFHDDISINILKCALDSYSIRRLSWASSRLPDEIDSSFEFTGNIIFVSNLDSHRIDEAVKSRTIVINLHMSRNEIVDYMKGIIHSIEPGTNIDTKNEVMSFLEENKDDFEQFNIRTFIKACRIRRGNPAQWRNLVKAIV